MSKFKPQGSDDGQGTVQKVIIGGWDGPVAMLQKEAAGEEELGLRDRLGVAIAA
jgi:hypothetical protein